MTRPLSEKNLAELAAQIDATGTTDMSKLTPMPKRRTRNNHEGREQKRVIAWWAVACNEYRVPEFLLMAIPNGMAFGGKEEWQIKTSCIRAKNAKLEGLRPGAPDLFLAQPIRSYGGLFIEMKTAIGRVSHEQILMQGHLIGRGYQVRVCRSSAEAIATIEKYLKP